MVLELQLETSQFEVSLVRQMLGLPNHFLMPLHKCHSLEWTHFLHGTFITVYKSDARLK